MTKSIRNITFGIVFFLMAISMIACGKKQIYVFPNEILEFMGTTAKEYEQAFNDPTRSDLPKEKYGKIYANQDGQLCFELTDEQLMVLCQDLSQIKMRNFSQ